MKCFWQTGCSDSSRCRKFGQCVAAWQNAHKEEIARPLEKIADKVLSYRAPARTAKAQKRQRARRKAQRESSI